MSISYKKVMFQVPERLLERVDFMAQQEERTRTSLLLEAVRDYEQKFQEIKSPHIRAEREKKLLESQEKRLAAKTGRAKMARTLRD